MDLPIWIPIVFFIIALVYSMVGFGGGSSYLAILVLAGLSHQAIPPIALMCNIIVTTGGLWHFCRAGFFQAKATIPFIILSIPMAYWGGTCTIGKETFSIILGIGLFLAAWRMFFANNTEAETRPISWSLAFAVGLPIGAGLGFLSGLVGIGGGIFLSPILILMRWVNLKEASAAASFFIVVNSASGLLAHLDKGFAHFEIVYPLIAAVFLGGQIGSRLGSRHIPVLALKRILACLILYASGRLMWGAL